MSKILRNYWAGAKHNGEFICVETYSGYRGGTDRDYKGKQHLLVSDASDEVLGAAVKDALAHSRFVLPAPRPGSVYPPELEFDMELCDYKKSAERYVIWIQDLMTTYGYKTKRALFKDMKSCGIELKDGILTIRPSYHEKLEAWSGHCISEDDYVVLPADSTPAEIGAALRLAFSRCL